MVDQVRQVAENLMNKTETVLNRALDNKYIKTAIMVFLGLYAAFAAPQLPKSLVGLMDHTLVRVAFAFVIVFMATRDPSIALLMAVAFILTLQTANKFRLYNTSLSKSAQGEVSWLPSVSGEAQSTESEQAPEQTHEQVNEDENIAELSMPSANLNEVVETMEGAETPDSVQNAASVESVTFTNNSQFDNAQNNNVPGANQDSCVKSWDSQHCIQGLEQNSPNGYEGGENADF